MAKSFLTGVNYDVVLTDVFDVDDKGRPVGVILLMMYSIIKRH